MARKELVDFLKAAQELKLNLDRIAKELILAGWSIEEVHAAVRAVKPRALKAPPLKAPKVPEALKPQLSAEEALALEHIRKLKASGLKAEQIKAAFIEKGWKAEVIEKLLEQA